MEFDSKHFDRFMATWIGSGIALFLIVVIIGHYLLFDWPQKYINAAPPFVVGGLLYAVTAPLAWFLTRKRR
jgi:drug/metabolite transporter (DMT)-like permease